MRLNATLKSLGVVVTGRAFVKAEINLSSVKMCWCYKYVTTNGGFTKVS